MTSNNTQCFAYKPEQNGKSYTVGRGKFAATYHKIVGLKIKKIKIILIIFFLLSKDYT